MAHQPPDVGGHLPGKAKRTTRMAQARQKAIQALEGDADLSELRTVARNLGMVVRDAAEDRALWDELARRVVPSRRLTDEQRQRLRSIVAGDWAPLLDSLGHQPPPASDVLADELALALSHSLAGEDGSDIEELRRRTRQLAQRLVELRGTAGASRRRLRSALWRALPVADRLVIVGDAAAGGLALTTPPTPPVAAAPAAGFATAVGIDVAMAVVTDGLVGVLHRAVPPVLPSHATEQAAFDAAAGFHRDDLEHLRGLWRAAGEQQVADVADSTRRVLVEWTWRLYTAWNLGVAAQPDNAAFDESCLRTANALSRAHETLGGTPDRDSVVQALDAVEQAATALDADLATVSAAAEVDAEIKSMIGDMEGSVAEQGFAARLAAPRPAVSVRAGHARRGGAPPGAHDLLNHVIDLGRRATEAAQSRRADAHDLLDQVIDVSHRATQSASGLARGFARLRSELQAAQPSAPAEGSPPVVVLPPQRPGEDTSGSLEIHNSSGRSVSLRLECAAFAGRGGARIQPQVHFTPDPLEITARTTEQVQMSLTIPVDAPRGTYVGLVESAGAPGVHALVHLRVI
jgi:hypothetical protein